jgi:ribonuclease BN (tRNA processing enzyme)
LNEPQGSKTLKIQLLPSAVRTTGGRELQFSTSYLINDSFAIDAGSLGFALGLPSQLKVKHVLLSHTHVDHIASLPVFLENTAEFSGTRVTIHGSQAVLDGLRRHVFNGCLWPNLIDAKLPNPAGGSGQPFFHLATLESGCPLEIAGVRITPVAVDHAVPTMGFLLEEGDAAVVLSLDTGPTEELWRRANALPKVNAVFLEASFPNSMDELAKIAKHLTPRMFSAEVRKLARPSKIIAIHIKPTVFDQVVEELLALNLPDLEIGMPGKEYCF